jgi:predicted CXXCH cytochrome family protein
MSDGFKNREHLFRVAALFVIGTGLFFVAKAFLVPKDFGKYGHYRASAVDEAAARPISFAGQAACIECHSDVQEVRNTARHAKLSCESCHGPLASHASGDIPKPARPEGRQICIGCHAANRSRPTAFPQVVIADHADDGPCIACHKPHAPKIAS